MTFVINILKRIQLFFRVVDERENYETFNLFIVRVGHKDVTPTGDKCRECKVHISVGAS